MVDEAGPGAAGFAVGDRVYGGALARAVADFVVLEASAVGAEGLFHTPDGVSDVVASTLSVAGAAVIGTASEGTFGFLRELGAEPVAYGAGLADRVRALVPGEVTAATDLFGTETAEAALALGVPPERVCTVAAGPNPPGGVRATGGIDAEPDALDRIAAAIAAGRITVPIAAVFPVEQLRDAVTVQAGRHVHGKIVVTM